MKQFLQVAYKITIIISVCSVLMSTIPAYHLLVDVNYKPIYKQLLFMNLKLIMLWIAVFLLGILITSARDMKQQKKRSGLSRRLSSRGQKPA